LTIGETYGFLLKKFSINTFKNNNANQLILLRRKYEPVIDYLLQLKEDKEPFNLPEGFKFVKKTKVKYNSRLAPHFLEILGEGKFICYQILEDILFNIFNSSIIEPYVEVFVEDTVELEPEKLHNWTPDLTMAYIDLEKQYRFHGIFAADALEDGLRKMMKNIRSKKVKDFEDEKNGQGEEGRPPFKLKMAWARSDIKKKMEQYKKKKMEDKQKKIDKQIEQFKLSKEEKQSIKEKLKDAKQRREKKEEERKNKILVEQEKRKEKEDKKIKECMDFCKGQQRKLKEQFKSIINKREEVVKKEEEMKEYEKKVKKVNQDNALQNKDKSYYTFEKNLYNTMKALVRRRELRDVFDNYNNHLKCIYDIYSKIGYNKISFFSKEVMRIEEFKQFLINFTVLGVVVSPEQMILIFNNISKVFQSQRNNQMYLEFDDFKISLCYLAIYSKLGNRDKRILPKDIEELSPDSLENFFMNILGLKKEFNKIELEKFINERRSLSMKSLLQLQHKIKKANSLSKINENKEDKEEDGETTEQNNESKSDIKYKRSIKNNSMKKRIKSGKPKEINNHKKNNIKRKKVNNIKEENEDENEEEEEN
jgi:hypothetical protein